MTFLWPELLWGIFLLPLLAAAYVWLLHRRKRGTVRYASLLMVRQAIGAGGSLPPPFAAIPVPAVYRPAPDGNSTACGDPDAPLSAQHRHPDHGHIRQHACNRRGTHAPGGGPGCGAAFVTAQHRAHAHWGRGVREVRLPSCRPPPPTVTMSLAAINRLELQRATAIGSGILVSLKAIFPEVDFDLGIVKPTARPTRFDEGQVLGPDARSRQARVQARAAGVLHLGGYHLAHRRRVERRTRPDRRPPAWQPSVASGFTLWAWARPRG